MLNNEDIKALESLATEKEKIALIEKKMKDIKALIEKKRKWQSRVTMVTKMVVCIVALTTALAVLIMTLN